MIAGVADTHAAISFLAGDPRLSVRAKTFIEDAARGRRKIVLSTISLVEVVYLVEKKRLSATAFEDLRWALASPNHVLEEATLTAGVAEAMRRVSRDEVPDMPDRIISATAVFLKVPLISRDGRIRTSSVPTIW